MKSRAVPDEPWDSEIAVGTLCIPPWSIMTESTLLAVRKYMHEVVSKTILDPLRPCDNSPVLVPELDLGLTMKSHYSAAGLCTGTIRIQKAATDGRTNVSAYRMVSGAFEVRNTDLRIFF